MPVLERVERDDGEATAGASSVSRPRQAARELAELVVDVDAQRLEGAGRRVSGRATSAQHAGDDWASCAVRVIGRRGGRRRSRGR